ncbi:MAG: hypothetical protein HQM08_04305 [Candidatus Riflebacteria bacterium]|nr:hypothetical protein [Candidatus Riflebacteria bacterium]
MLPTEKTIEMPGIPFVKEIIRPLTDRDNKTLEEIARREKDAFSRSKVLINQHKLNMKLLKAEYLFDFSRLILYYKADHKVDFRELLKSLAAAFRTRIELRQIGVRDETKLLGGIGCCGKEVCCAQFLQSFHPVSTKMAKDQNLSLNPTKLSGICSRLLCCLSYEHEYYLSFQGKYPKIGQIILSDGEVGWVNDINFVMERMVIVFPDRRKVNYPLNLISGSKDQFTGRFVWWVNEPGKFQFDVTAIAQKFSEFEAGRNPEEISTTAFRGKPQNSAPTDPAEINGNIEEPSLEDEIQNENEKNDQDISEPEIAPEKQ